MTRARDALAAAAWWAVLMAALVWWAPSLGLGLARLWADRLRFRAAIRLGRALAAAGYSEAARRVYGAERRRAERRMREIRRRAPRQP